MIFIASVANPDDSEISSHPAGNDNSIMGRGEQRADFPGRTAKSDVYIIIIDVCLLMGKTLSILLVEENTNLMSFTHKNTA